jgi:SHS2 domain-containing protein
MTASYRILEDIALADAAFEAQGDTPSELCRAAAQAVIETMVDPQTVSPTLTRSVVRQEQSLEDLLFDWLHEIVYLKDKETLVFQRADCTVTHEPNSGLWQLKGTLVGEPIAPERHALRADVKAVTKHRYTVWRDERGWMATVVLDI